MKNTSQAPARDWFDRQNWKVYPFQKKAWSAYLAGKSGIINAPTGFGKTYSLVLPILLDALAHQDKEYHIGLQCLWITPLRALSKEIFLATERAIEALGIDWKVGIRTGDTKASERVKQMKNPPHILITTPESLHIMLATKGYDHLFRNFKSIIIDEWHELLGSKRGVQVELGLSRLKAIKPKLRVWGISATIGNLGEAMEVLFGGDYLPDKQVLITSKAKKQIELISLIPDDIKSFPWAGHFGTRMLDKVLPIIDQSQSTIIFCNTRAMCEHWYQILLNANPDLAGQTAMHHGSISRELRDWVEDALHDGRLKAVVSTSSLDLGVDFRPVDTVIQIGSPKGVARCIQRAGRSGHQPGKISTLYFAPTHALELIEAASLRKAIKLGKIESRTPYVRSFDVLIQYCVTLAISDGFYGKELFKEVKNTFCFESISDDEWNWVLSFITVGGKSLQAYDEFRRVERNGDLYFVKDKRVAMRHRLSMGTIVGSSSVHIQFLSGKRLGTIEEYFIGQLNPGDIFWFAGRSLEFVRLKDNTAQVRKSNSKKGKIPSWQGGRMPLSSSLSAMLLEKIVDFHHHRYVDRELKELKPILDLQQAYSHVPDRDECLIEMFESKEGYHLIMYTFEGRFVHEGMSTLLASRIAKIVPITFSIAMNDYGFELLSDQPIPIEKAIEQNLFDTSNLEADIQKNMNSTELAKRRFREISRISGLVFPGYPGKPKKSRHLQSSASLLFNVFQEYEPDNLLYLQTYDETLYFQMEHTRLKNVMERIQSQKIIIKKPDRFSPFAFPIVADRLRAKMSSEQLKDRIAKMKLALIEG